MKRQVKKNYKKPNLGLGVGEITAIKNCLIVLWKKNGFDYNKLSRSEKRAITPRRYQNILQWLGVIPQPQVQPIMEAKPEVQVKYDLNKEPNELERMFLDFLRSQLEMQGKA